MKAYKFGAVLSTAALLAAVSAPALAQSTDPSVPCTVCAIGSDTNINQTAAGTGDISAETTAADPATNVHVTNASATLVGNVLQAAAGNIGANMASGIGNQQANVTRINSYAGYDNVNVNQHLGNLDHITTSGGIVTTGTVANDSTYHVYSSVGNNTDVTTDHDTTAATEYNNSAAETKHGYSLNASGNAGLAVQYNTTKARQTGKDQTYAANLNASRALTENHNFSDTSTTSYNYANTNTQGVNGNGNGSGNYAYAYKNANTGTSFANNAGAGAGAGSFGYNYTLVSNENNNGNGSRTHGFTAVGANTENATAVASITAGSSARTSTFDNTQSGLTFAAAGYLNLGVATDKTQSHSYASNNGSTYDRTDSDIENYSYTNTTTDANVYDDRVVHYFDSNGGSTAGIGDNVGAQASGNIGMNVAAGAFNNQANAAVVSSRLFIGHAGAINVDQSIGNISDVSAYNPVAFASGNALQGAHGNVGLNIASGIANQQTNILNLQP